MCLAGAHRGHTEWPPALVVAVLPSYRSVQSTARECCQEKRADAE